MILLGAPGTVLAQGAGGTTVGSGWVWTYSGSCESPTAVTPTSFYVAYQDAASAASCVGFVYIRMWPAGGGRLSVGCPYESDDDSFRLAWWRYSTFTDEPGSALTPVETPSSWTPIDAGEAEGATDPVLTPTPDMLRQRPTTPLGVPQSGYVCGQMWTTYRASRTAAGTRWDETPAREGLRQVMFSF